MRKILSIIASVLLLCGCQNTQTQTKNDYKFLDAKEKSFEDFTVYWLKDNASDHKFPFELFGNVSDEVKKAVNMPEGMPSSISAYLIKTNNKYLLFDSGLGQKAGGQLLTQLQNIGVTPENIDYVYITHFHGDHIGGMLTPEGEKVFTNADVYVGRLEKESDLGKTESAVKMLEQYGEKIHTFEFGDVLPENVLALDAVGHTPGHTVFRKGDLLITGDLMHALNLQLPYPEYCANFDGDKENAVKSRKKILEYAKDNKLTICGMHLPY